MGWRTNREGLIHGEEYLCEIDDTEYDVLRYSRLSCGDEEDYITWSSEFVYKDNQITKWCPLSEIVEFLNTGDSGNEIRYIQSMQDECEANNSDLFNNCGDDG